MRDENEANNSTELPSVAGFVAMVETLIIIKCSNSLLHYVLKCFSDGTTRTNVLWAGYSSQTIVKCYSNALQDQTRLRYQKT
jgi:hypothetical protein